MSLIPGKLHSTRGYSNNEVKAILKSHLNSYAYLRNLIVSKKNKFDKIRDIKEKQKCQPSRSKGQ